MSESVSDQNEIIENCKDILLDLKDDGYTSHINTVLSYPGDSVRIKILCKQGVQESSKTFGINIRESITRIRDYMLSIGYIPRNLHFDMRFYQIDYFPK